MEFPECEPVYRAFNKRQYRMLAQHSWPWQKVLATYGGWQWKAIGLFESPSYMVGCIPFCEREADVGKVIMSSPLPASYSGVLHIDDCDKEGIYANLLRTLIEYAMDRKVDIVTILTSPFRDDAELYVKHLRPTYSLGKFYQYLPGKIHPKKNLKSKFRNNLKRNLKKAQTNGLKFKYSKRMATEKVNTWYSNILVNRFGDIGAKPPSRRFLLKILEELGPEGLGTFSYVEHEGKMVAGGIFLYGWAQDIYLRAASTDYLKMGASIYLDYMMLEKGFELKVNAHNFQSSSSRTSPIYKYKKQWRCSEANTYYLVKVLTDPNKFIKLGSEKVAKLFPHFFVIPFSTYG